MGRRLNDFTWRDVAAARAVVSIQIKAVANPNFRSRLVSLFVLL